MKAAQRPGRVSTRLSSIEQHRSPATIALPERAGSHTGRAPGMLLRWLGAAVLRAEAGFRGLRGHRDMIKLVAALDRTIKTKSLDLSREAA